MIQGRIFRLRIPKFWTEDSLRPSNSSQGSPSTSSEHTSKMMHCLPSATSHLIRHCTKLGQMCRASPISTTDRHKPSNRPVANICCNLRDSRPRSTICKVDESALSCRMDSRNYWFPDRTGCRKEIEIVIPEFLKPIMLRRSEKVWKGWILITDWIIIQLIIRKSLKFH